jgi:hypothetical protein
MKNPGISSAGSYLAIPAKAMLVMAEAAGAVIVGWTTDEVSEAVICNDNSGCC